MSGVGPIIDSTPRNGIEEQFRSIEVRFFRTITTDDDLATALVDELDRRGVGANDYIAVLSECDTFYGSDLPRSFESALKRKRQGGIKAVGVLGSDFYGKMLILQAVHDRLPGSLFFSTDLDARYLDPAEYEWARNVIIASSFGLKLDPSRQGHAPPFRDSYQTARFFGTNRTPASRHGSSARGWSSPAHGHAEVI